MESFYGGRQGASIVIKARFKYITDQQQNNNDSQSDYIDPYYKAALKALQAGESHLSEEEAKAVLAPDTMTVQLSDPHYTDVWYNEYCIIDAANKNNVNNGKIYRRTLKSTNDEDPIGSFAEYIGQIVGPTGSSPQLGDFTDTTTLQNKFNYDKGHLEIDDILTYIGERTVDGELVEKWTVAEGNQSDPPMKIRPLISGTNLIPGNTQINNEYIQQGSYGWYNIRKNTSDTDTSLVYLGFDIPYYVTEFATGDTLNYTNTLTVSPTINVEETVAPFYEKYEISVPRGITGAYLYNIRKELFNSNNHYCLFNDILYDASNDKYYVNTSTITSSDFTTGQLGWVGEFRYPTIDGIPQKVYDTQDNEMTLFLGSVKEIKDITLSDSGNDSGTLTITYTDNSEDTSFENKLTWITDALVVTGSENDTLDRYIGHLLVRFNNDSITPGSPVRETTNYNSYRDLGLVKTIEEGLFVESKGYSLLVDEDDDIATIETKIHNYLRQLSGNNAPDERKAQIVTITKGEGSSATIEKAVVYWNSKANSGNGKWELLGDTVSGEGGSARNGAVLEVPSGEGDGYEPGSTDLIFKTIEISSSTLANYPPAFPV